MHLLQPVRIPAQHTRLLNAKNEGSPLNKQAYLEAIHKDLMEKGLVVEERIISAVNNQTILAIHNSNLSLVHLEGSGSIGWIVHDYNRRS